VKRRQVVTKGHYKATSSTAPTSRAAFTGHSGARSHAPRRHVPIDPRVVYADLLEDLEERNQGFAWACCPFHDDRRPSLCVNLESGWYKCHSSSCGETGSNIVGFVGRLLGLEYAEARRHLETHYGS
jgi:CHC2 zinc finger